MFAEDKKVVEVAQAPSILERSVAQIKKTGEEILMTGVYASMHLGEIIKVFLWGSISTLWLPVTFGWLITLSTLKFTRNNIQYVWYAVVLALVVEKLWAYVLVDSWKQQITGMIPGNNSETHDYAAGMFHYYYRRIFPSDQGSADGIISYLADRIMELYQNWCRNPVLRANVPHPGSVCEAFRRMENKNQWWRFPYFNKGSDMTAEEAKEHEELNQRLREVRSVVVIIAWIQFCVVVIAFVRGLYRALSHAWMMRNVKTVEQFAVRGDKFRKLGPREYVKASGETYKAVRRVIGTDIYVECPEDGPTMLQSFLGSRQAEANLAGSNITPVGAIHPGILTFVRKDGSVIGQGFRTGTCIVTARHVWTEVLKQDRVEAQCYGSKRAVSLQPAKWTLIMRMYDVLAFTPQKGFVEQLALKNMKMQPHPTTGAHKIEWLGAGGARQAFGALQAEWVSNQERLHTISTQDGTSGAPVTNSHDEVVGMHVATRPSLGQNSYVEAIDILVALGVKIDGRKAESDLPRHIRSVDERTMDSSEPQDDEDPDAFWNEKGRGKFRGRDAHHLEVDYEDNPEKGKRGLSEAALARQERNMGIGGRLRLVESDFQQPQKTVGTESANQEVGTPPTTQTPNSTSAPGTAKKTEKEKGKTANAAPSAPAISTEPQAPARVATSQSPDSSKETRDSERKSEPASKSAPAEQGTIPTVSVTKQRGKPKQGPASASSARPSTTTSTPHAR